MGEAALTLAHSIVNILDEKKAEDILLLDLGDICSFTDYFVISTGSSERGLKALTDEVARKVSNAHGHPVFHVEGDAGSGWILMDYGDVIVHLFSQHLRNYYRLEDLWREARVVAHIR